MNAVVRTHRPPLHALMYQVFDLYGARPPRDWSGDLHTLLAKRRSAVPTPPARASGTQPSLPIERYVGTYADSAYGIIEISLANGALRARFEKADLGTLEHWEYDAFRSRPAPGDSPTTLTFVPTGTGTVSSVRAYGITFVRARQ